MVKIAVIGGIVADIAVKTPRLPRLKETFLADSFKLGPGGKGANAAVAVARAGAAAVLVGCVGDDEFGQMIMTHLLREGVDVGSVSVAPAGISTGMGIAMITNDGDNSILGVMGANDHLRADKVVGSLDAHKDSLNAILINFEVPEEAVAAGVETGMRLGIPVIVDAGPARGYGSQAWDKCTILTPNIQEMGVLAGCELEDDKSCLKAAQELLAKGPRAVVLHRGERGALIVTAERCLEVPAFPVKSVDTTGAGDAFCGTLAVGVAQGVLLERAVYRANAAGALAVTRLGTLPIMPTCREIDTFLEEVLCEPQGRTV